MTDQAAGRVELAPGLNPTCTVHTNLQGAVLLEMAVSRGEGQLTEHGAFNAITTPHTGRSPNDKFVAREPEIEDDIWWGKVNQEMSPENFSILHGDVLEYLAAQELFVQDLYGGPTGPAMCRFAS